MEKMVSFTIKLTTERHKKLKVLSALSGESMTDLVSQWIDKQDVQYHGSSKRPLKPESIDQSINAPMAYSEYEVKVQIMAMQAKGLKPWSIAKNLQSDGVPTKRGGKWSAQTVSNMLKRWSNTPDPV